MKIAIYCGSFDPIGNHHIENAIHLLNHVNQVWIIPELKSLNWKKLIDINHRIEMCNLAVQSLDIKYHDKILVNDFLTKNQCNFSHELIQKLKQEFKDNIYYFALGADNALTINTWTNWEKLINSIPFIVIPRKGYTVSTHQWFHDKPHIFMGVHENPGSSTIIRKNIKDNIDISNHVAKNVGEYIMKNKLYMGKMD